MRALQKFLRHAVFGSVVFATALPVVAEANERIVYQLGWVPGGSNAVEYLAKADGFFAAEGLDVDIISGNGASDTLTRVAAGTADIGIAGIETLLAAQAEQPVPVKAVFAFYSRKPDSIHVPADSGIESVADLAGKTIAIGAYSSSNVVWPLFAQRNGLDLTSINLMQVDASAVAPMMAAGQADALINWITVAPIDRAVMQAAGRDMRVIPWSRYGYEGYGQALIVSDRVLAERPEAVEAFLRAFVKATDAAIAEPSKAGQAIHDLVPEVDPVIAAAEFEESIPLIRNEISQKNGFGVYETSLLRTTWEWVAASRSLDPDILDPSSVIDANHLPE